MEEYQAMARRLLDEAFNKGNLDVVDEALSPERITFHMSGEMQAPSGLKLIISLMRQVFPDIQVAIEDTMYENDRAIVRWSATATRADNGQGAAPAGEKANWTGLSINRFSGGKISEMWLYIDSKSSDA